MKIDLVGTTADFRRFGPPRPFQVNHLPCENCAMLGRIGEVRLMLLSIIGELRVGTSPRPIMATRLIVPEEQLRAAGWNGELP